MNDEKNDEKITMEKKDADYSRYLAYQEALKSLRNGADGGK